MPKYCYVEKRFSAASQELIDHANAILDEYEPLGIDPTLRQLYYQLVSRGIIANKQSEYNRLGNVINDARLAGLIDWNRIQDLTRELRSLAHWESPKHILDAVADQYRIDKWKEQTVRPEVWIEKDALRNVVAMACDPLDVPYFSCRGYVSQSEMWAAAQRLLIHEDNGQQCIIFHLGDHDPSGIDMTRDIESRLTLFGAGVEIRRIALNIDQVRQYNPPPNPAKLTDSRIQGYLTLYGDESWELDALDPTTLINLITDEITDVRDEWDWKEATKQEAKEKSLLGACSRQWDSVVSYLNTSEDLR